MLDRDLAAAFIDGPARHVCLGVRLQPFSLWHRFLLRALDSPVFKGEPITLPQLRDAVAVCRLRPFQCKLRKPVPGCYFLRHGFKAEVERFTDYCGDYITRPEWVVVAEKAPKDAAPPEARGVMPDDITIAADIIGWTGWPEKYVWALPIGRAYWYQMCAQRAAGLDVDYTDEGERQFRAEAKAAEGARRERAFATFQNILNGVGSPSSRSGSRDDGVLRLEGEPSPGINGQN